MALFEKVNIVHANGDAQTVSAGPLSTLEVKQGGNSVCVSKEDVLSIKKETTCVHLPSVQIHSSR